MNRSELNDKAKKYISNAGFGAGTNITLHGLECMMVDFYLDNQVENLRTPKQKKPRTKTIKTKEQIVIEQKVINAACEVLGITEIKKERTQIDSLARWMVLYYLKNYTPYSNQAAADVFNQDHSTTNHGCKSIIQLVETDDKKYMAAIIEFCIIMGIELPSENI